MIHFFFLVPYNNENPGPALEEDRLYHLQIDVTQNQWGIKVDGVLMHEGSKGRHETNTTVPCYASFPDDDEGDAVIDNIVISPGFNISESLTL